MTYIKFDLENNREFLLKPEGEEFLIHLASNSCDCETLKVIIEFGYMTEEIISIIIKRFTENEKHKWLNNGFGYYVLECIAKNESATSEILEKIYDFVKEIHDCYWGNLITSPVVLVNIIKHIAQNPNTSEGVICKLLASYYTKNDDVKAAALEQVKKRGIDLSKLSI